MKDCDVIFNAGILDCKKIKGGHCALLLNEGIEDGDTTNLLQSLKKQSNNYLKILTGNEAGTIYNQCAMHDKIQSLAIKILRDREAK